MNLDNNSATVVIERNVLNVPVVHIEKAFNFFHQAMQKGTLIFNYSWLEFPELIQKVGGESNIPN